ncbi:MAG TPA: protein phosphatase CheZ [Thauera aminoaromatica]|uniref:Protein phosphatase CheZ n=2 Tax=Thauera aminoaromatica TaxID=164330 RepID=N6YS03_THASP|nr:MULTISPECIES: protein phosphatase CheZ [Thauera]MDA0235840.1 protein phosphatase CheZ [Pseudomonadota bacterium]OPZ04057.1 MAG: chemotaxis regulator CheZ [Alphaproteobacteria bacterium ADurb.BinA305]TMW77540.1 protein phosphatase CheZ [Thauera sp. UPWRP]ACR01817.1 chemotaxis phosphatase, CheZ [Thauera aminoaromatica]ENO85147.1 chemotaxis regulator CheZ [Thauera aminoaromatica S2]
MSKKSKVDSMGDSDELQALFDSIAADPFAAAGAGAEPAASILPVDESGDNDELQALFDAVAEQAGAAAPVAGGTVENAGAAAGEGVVYNRLGQLARQVHDALRELGLDTTLHRAAEAVPDARQRLTYVARTTEQAASRVLNATDVAGPIQTELANGADALCARWDELYAGRLSPEAFRELSADTRAFLGTVGDGARSTGAQLHEIMMAQDFQDLTGQVIKRLVELTRTLETQLLQVLIEAAPAQVLEPEQAAGLLNGPVIDPAGRSDVVQDQAQVDELLERLGF